MILGMGLQALLAGAAEFGPAEAAYKRGDYPQAAKLLESFLDKNSKGEQARFARLYLADMEKDLGKSIDAYRRLVDEKSSDEVAQLAQKGIAERYYLVSRYSEARDNYHRFLEAYPNSSLSLEVKFWYGTCLVLLNRLEDGMVIFGQVSKSKDGERARWADLAFAECLLKLERFTEAEAKLKSMLGTKAEKDLGNLIYYHLGECYENQKKASQAAAAYRRVVRDYPGSFEVEEAKRRLELLRLENPTAVGASVRYSVQVGAFSKRQNAQALADKLKGKGFPAYVAVDKARAGEVTLYRVRTADYESREEAENQSRLLASREKMSGMVVELDGE